MQYEEIISPLTRSKNDKPPSITHIHMWTVVPHVVLPYHAFILLPREPRDIFGGVVYDHIKIVSFHKVYINQVEVKCKRVSARSFNHPHRFKVFPLGPFNREGKFEGAVICKASIKDEHTLSTQIANILRGLNTFALMVARGIVTRLYGKTSQLWLAIPTTYDCRGFLFENYYLYLRNPTLLHLVPLQVVYSFRSNTSSLVWKAGYFNTH